jgi:hypothetical protein
MRLHMVATLLFATAVAYSQSDASTGSICGIVQNENGAPASFVKVVAIYQGAHTQGYFLQARQIVPGTIALAT